MIKKALILDLDNTIYPVSAIGQKLFKPLFELIESNGEFFGDIDSVKTEIMRRPYQHVAKDFEFSESLFSKSMELMNNLTYEEPISPFDDYRFIKDLPVTRYLVTVGFTKLQQSKIKHLGIESDFASIYIIDPNKTDMNKKDMFVHIMQAQNLKTTDILVTGDDLNSEIKAATDLGIDAVLYDRNDYYPNKDIHRICSFADLKSYL